MKAIVQTRYGSAAGLQLQDINKPQPKDNEILIRVHSASVTAGDVVLRKMNPLMFIPMRLFGIKPKQVPGHEFSGVVESVGSKVTLFKTGDEVVGTTTGLSIGANEEYICMVENGKSGMLAHKPENLSFDEAAVLPVGAMTAMFLLQTADIQPQDEVLIYGASGSVGSYAVQIAKEQRGIVTAVCSTRNVDLLRSLGADNVLDYRKENVMQGESSYNVVFDAVGKTTAADWKSVMKSNGKFITVKSMTQESHELFQKVLNLAGKGKIKAVIDCSYPLSEVADAHRYVESGHKTGNIVINVI